MDNNKKIVPYIKDGVDNFNSKNGFIKSINKGKIVRSIESFVG